VLIVVHTLGGEVLLLRRCQPPDFWQSVTGSLEWGETPEAAARRELFEETGLPCRRSPRLPASSIRFSILPAWRARYAPDVTENLEHVFRLGLEGRRAIRLNPAEHTDYRWVPAAEAVERGQLLDQRRRHPRAPVDRSGRSIMREAVV
jgi:dihydroneopterin triphosphate diphosphatase